jgi:hypothetical protein
VVRNGGFAAHEASDGKYLYYAKGIDDPSIWRVPVEGGQESAVSPAIRPLTPGTRALVSTGVVFVEAGMNDGPTVSLYDFSTQRVRHLRTLEKSPSSITVTRDARSILFDQPSQEESYIVVLENFR